MIKTGNKIGIAGHAPAPRTPRTRGATVVANLRGTPNGTHVSKKRCATISDARDYVATIERDHNLRADNTANRNVYVMTRPGGVVWVGNVTIIPDAATNRY